MIAKLERTHSNVQQNMEQTQNPTMGATINNRTAALERPTPFLLFVWKSQYGENVSVDAIDNNTRLKN